MAALAETEEFEVVASVGDGAEAARLAEEKQPDLVVMDIEAFSRREKMLALRETLLDIERDRINGAKYYSVDEVDAELRRAIAEASGHGRAEV